MMDTSRLFFIGVEPDYEASLRLTHTEIAKQYSAPISSGIFGCQFWQFTGQQKLPILAIICLPQLPFLAKHTQAQLSTKSANIGNNMFIKVAIFGKQYTSTVVNINCQNWMLMTQCRPKLLSNETSSEPDHQHKFYLPKLPEPLEEMNGRTLKSIVTAIAKDMRLLWDGEAPEFWPRYIPYTNHEICPRSFKGHGAVHFGR